MVNSRNKTDRLWIKSATTRVTASVTVNKIRCNQLSQSVISMYKASFRWVLQRRNMIGGRVDPWHAASVKRLPSSTVTVFKPGKTVRALSSSSSANIIYKVGSCAVQLQADDSHTGELCIMISNSFSTLAWMTHLRHTTCKPFKATHKVIITKHEPATNGPLIIGTTATFCYDLLLHIGMTVSERGSKYCNEI